MEEAKAAPAENSGAPAPVESNKVMKLTSDLADRRNAIYQKFDALSATEAAKSESAPDAEISKESDSAEKPEASQSDSSSVKEEKKEEQTNKTVPYEALKEEREKRKQANLRLREQDERIKALEQKLNDLSSKPSTEDSFSTETVDDATKKRLADLEAEVRKNKLAEQQAEIKRVNEEKRNLVKKLDQQLSSEGHPGFEYALAKTKEVMDHLYLEGDFATQQEYEDPANWVKAFKEHVSPNLSEMFKAKAKEEHFSQKKDAKKKANVVSSPGKAPQAEPEKSEEDVSMEDINKQFMKDRKAGLRRIKG